MMPRRHPVIATLAAVFLFGLMLGHWGWTAPLALMLAAAVVAWAGRRTVWLLPALVVLALAAGICRGGQVDDRQLAALSGQKVLLTGTVTSDPAPAGQLTEYDVGELANRGRRLSGTIRLYSTNSHLVRGYRVSVAGKLKPSDRAVPYTISFAQVTVVSARLGWLERLRQNFFTGLRDALPEPLAGFGLGLLVGSRALIPKSLQDALAAVGLSHLVAVSGYNLTILIGAVGRGWRRLSYRLYVILSLWLIAGFCLVAGFSASIVRAAIVSALMLVAGFYGRQLKPITVVAVAAVITAAANPRYLWADAGWQLSFLAFFGILVVAPLVTDRLPKRGRAVTAMAVEAASAQLMTLPLIMAVFGQLPLAGLLANLIVLPLVPAAMLLSFVAGLAGMFVPALAGWAGLPATWLLRLMLAVVDKLNHGTSQVVVLPPVHAVILYILLAGLVLGAAGVGRKRTLKYN